MKKIILTISAFSLFALNGAAFAADGAELAEACLDCHEFAYDFEGASVEEMTALITARLEVKKHKATQGMTADDVAALAEYISAEANK